MRKRFAMQAAAFAVTLQRQSPNRAIDLPILDTAAPQGCSHGGFPLPERLLPVDSR